jgi:hypothetical protein
MNNAMPTTTTTLTDKVLSALANWCLQARELRAYELVLAVREGLATPEEIRCVEMLAKPFVTAAA